MGYGPKHAVFSWLAVFFPTLVLHVCAYVFHSNLNRLKERRGHATTVLTGKKLQVEMCEYKGLYLGMQFQVNVEPVRWKSSLGS